MFKPLPDVIVTQGCGNEADRDHSINWEDIAKWALEHGDLEDAGETCGQRNTGAPHGSPAIDWCRVGESFMRDEAANDEGDVCDAREINYSIRAHDHPVLLSESYPSTSVSQLAANGYPEFPSPSEYRERLRTPDSRNGRNQPVRRHVRMDDTEMNRSMRDSDFNTSSCYNGTPLSSIRDFSCMEDLHDSTQDYQSDIMSYLEGRAERNRPNSIAEGYHFPGRAYGRADNGYCRMITSTPKKKHRTTRAETFEMADGSKMFHVTFEEVLAYGRKLRHISDVRDTNGCQIMQMDREIEEDINGAKRRVDVARRWLDLDQEEEEDEGCS